MLYANKHKQETMLLPTTQNKMSEIDQAVISIWEFSEWEFETNVLRKLNELEENIEMF